MTLSMKRSSPDPDVRKRLMPELFHCDMDEFFETCEIFADSPELNGLLVVSDEAEPYNVFQFYLSEAKATLMTRCSLSDQGGSLPEDFLQFHERRRLPEILQLDLSSCIRTTDCILFIWQ